MTKVRHPAVAGRFYPADARELRATVRACMAAAPGPPPGPAPKAIIAPHAGYVYSGPIAATAYARLAADRETIRRVVLLGPAHRVPFAGLAAPSDDAFETPLGAVRIDREALDAAAALPQVQVYDRPHDAEHSLEVHLPFLQETLGDVSLVPFAVGDASAAEVGEVIDALWGGPETRIVISSDLSHYHDYETASRLDEATSRAIEALRPEAIRYEDACGRNPINGMLTVARARGLRAATIDLRSSGDTAGPRDQVVGYGAYIFE
jgi:AmmeMemoRadiSam system protein B